MSTYIIVKDGKVIRVADCNGGAVEAIYKLKPNHSEGEFLFLKVGGQPDYNVKTT